MKKWLSIVGLIILVQIMSGIITYPGLDTISRVLAMLGTIATYTILICVLSSDQKELYIYGNMCAGTPGRARRHAITGAVQLLINTTDGARWITLDSDKWSGFVPSGETHYECN